MTIQHVMNNDIINNGTTLTSTINSGIFRAYDIRGIIDETLDANVAFQLGQAIGSMTLRAGDTAIVIGRDGRLSSPLLAQSLGEGILTTGCNVIDIDAVPTPLVYFSTHTLSTRSGVMITGSHNPANYNGFKIVIAGETLWGDHIQTLYKMIIENDFEQGHGQYTKHEIITDYINQISDDVKLKRPLKIVVDCGNGIPGIVAPTLFKKMGCEVIELFCDVDGRFPNHHPDPSQIPNLQTLITTIKSENADIGVAFDGDGDRLGVVTQTGEVIWPDRLMVLFSQQVLQQFAGSTIVFDVKCSKFLADTINNAGGKALMWKTGHSLIKAKMRETKAKLAGEMSGHLYFADRWYGFDDAIYAAARLLEQVSVQKNNMILFEQLPNSVSTPEINVQMQEGENFALIDTLQKKMQQLDDAKVITIDGLRIEYDDGWGLVRASNTTPSLVLRFEANDEHALKRIQTIFKDALLAYDKNLKIPF